MAELSAEEVQGWTDRILDPESSLAESQKIYSEMAAHYDKVTSENFPWAPVVVRLAEGMHRSLGNHKEQRILDIGAGTGVLGIELVKHGYTNLDALDLNTELLKLAEERKLYKNIICGRLGGKLDIKSDAYDAVVGAGLFLPGHAAPDCFPEMIRILKPGGLFICNVAERWKEDAPQVIPYFTDFEAKIQEHVKAGDWILEGRDFIEKYTPAGNGAQFYCRIKK